MRRVQTISTISTIENSAELSSYASLPGQNSNPEPDNNNNMADDQNSNPEPDNNNNNIAGADSKEEAAEDKEEEHTNHPESADLTSEVIAFFRCIAQFDDTYLTRHMKSDDEKVPYLTVTLRIPEQ